MIAIFAVIHQLIVIETSRSPKLKCLKAGDVGRGSTLAISSYAV